MYSTLEELPSNLTSLLRAALAAENSAAGPARRASQRTTRYLLGAALANGAAVAALAALTGTAPTSVRMRAATGGIVSAAEFAQLAHVSTEDILIWQAQGLLAEVQSDPIGTIGYPTEALVRALLLTSERTAAVTAATPIHSPA